MEECHDQSTQVIYTMMFKLVTDPVVSWCTSATVPGGLVKSVESVGVIVAKLPWRDKVTHWLSRVQCTSIHFYQGCLVQARQEHA